MVDTSTIEFDFISFFTICITWDSPNDNFNEIYQYELGFTSVPNIHVFTTAPKYEFDTPQPNFNYAINITACNDVGCGDVSETVQFTSITTGLSIYLFVYLSVCLSALLY